MSFNFNTPCLSTWVNNNNGALSQQQPACQSQVDGNGGGSSNSNADTTLALVPSTGYPAPAPNVYVGQNTSAAPTAYAMVSRTRTITTTSNLNIRARATTQIRHVSTVAVRNPHQIRGGISSFNISSVTPTRPLHNQWTLGSQGIIRFHQHQDGNATTTTPMIITSTGQYMGRGGGGRFPSFNMRAPTAASQLMVNASPYQRPIAPAPLTRPQQQHQYLQQRPRITAAATAASLTRPSASPRLVITPARGRGEVVTPRLTFHNHQARKQQLRQQMNEIECPIVVDVSSFATSSKPSVPVTVTVENAASSSNDDELEIVEERPPRVIATATRTRSNSQSSKSSGAGGTPRCSSVEVRDRQRENERARRKFTKDQTCELRSMVGVPQKEKMNEGKVMELAKNHIVKLRTDLKRKDDEHAECQTKIRKLEDEIMALKATVNIPDGSGPGQNHVWETIKKLQLVAGAHRQKCVELVQFFRMLKARRFQMPQAPAPLKPNPALVGSRNSIQNIKQPLPIGNQFSAQRPYAESNNFQATETAATDFRDLIVFNSDPGDGQSPELGSCGVTQIKEEHVDTEYPDCEETFPENEGSLHAIQIKQETDSSGTSFGMSQIKPESESPNEYVDPFGTTINEIKQEPESQDKHVDSIVTSINKISEEPFKDNAECDDDEAAASEGIEAVDQNDTNAIVAQHDKASMSKAQAAEALRLRREQIMMLARRPALGYHVQPLRRHSDSQLEQNFGELHLMLQQRKVLSQEAPLPPSLDLNSRQQQDDQFGHSSNSRPFPQQQQGTVDRGFEFGKSSEVPAPSSLEQSSKGLEDLPVPVSEIKEEPVDEEEQFSDSDAPSRGTDVPLIEIKEEPEDKEEQSSDSPSLGKPHLPLSEMKEEPADEEEQYSDSDERSLFSPTPVSKIKEEPVDEEEQPENEETEKEQECFETDDIFDDNYYMRRSSTKSTVNAANTLRWNNVQSVVSSPSRICQVQSKSRPGFDDAYSSDSSAGEPPSPPSDLQLRRAKTKRRRRFDCDNDESSSCSPPEWIRALKKQMLLWDCETVRRMLNIEKEARFKYFHHVTNKEELDDLVDEMLPRCEKIAKERVAAKMKAAQEEKEKAMMEPKKKGRRSTKGNQKRKKGNAKAATEVEVIDLEGVNTKRSEEAPQEEVEDEVQIVSLSVQDKDEAQIISQSVQDEDEAQAQMISQSVQDEAQMINQSVQDEDEAQMISQSAQDEDEAPKRKRGRGRKNNGWTKRKRN